MKKTNKTKSPSWFAKIGAMGGKARTASKGFGADRMRASLAGKLGGALGRRGRKLSDEERTDVIERVMESLENRKA